MKWLVSGLALLLLGIMSAVAQTATPQSFRATGNPILSDGRYYSTDPAPLVVGDRLYILAGRDEAPADVNDFIMKEWQLLSTSDPDSGRWTHYPAIARPEAVFAWAEPGRAYAGQIVQGRDGRFYLYAPVLQRDSGAEDRFAIGVAVADSPLGPWRDAHPAGPIISQQVPVPNRIQNIDPTVLVDDDGRVFIYWGTFGRLRAMELAADMVTPKGPQQVIDTLTGFFEAPWIMKRKGTYYLLYAGNNAGPRSACTPALYHACQAYGTAPSPLGPWTYRGVLLRPVSSTTSHAGAVMFKGQWYLAYHTADARGGGHFRRAVALDRLEWDDTRNPAAILPVQPTRARQAPPPPSRNIAGAAMAVAANDPIPVRYWIKALNDGIVRPAPLPPDMWASGLGENSAQTWPAQTWIEYRWSAPVRLNASRIWFVADQQPGAATGMAPPAAWHLEVWGQGGWQRLEPLGAPYGTAAGNFQEVRFNPISTRCLRAVFTAAGRPDAPAAIGVQEWEALAPNKTLPAPPPVPAAPACGP